MSIFICGLIFLVLIIYNKILSSEKTSPLVNFIFSFILVYLHVFLNNTITKNSIIGMFYKLLIILSSLYFLVLCFRSVLRFSIKTLRFREELLSFSFAILYLSLTPLTFFGQVSTYVLTSIQLFFFTTLLFSNCPFLMSKTIIYQYKRKLVNDYRNIRNISNISSFPIYIIYIPVLFDRVVYEFKSLRKDYSKLKFLSYTMLVLIIFLALSIEYKWLGNTFTLIVSLCLFGFFFYLFISFVKFLVVVTYLMLLTALSELADEFKHNPIMWVLVVFLIFYSFSINTLLTLLIFCFIITILFIDNTFSLTKSRYRSSERYFNYRLAKIVVKKLKKFTDSSSRKSLTFYIAVNLYLYVWFLSIIAFFLIFNAPKGYTSVAIYILLIPLIYYTLRAIMYFKINGFWFLFFLLFSSFGIFLANVKMINGLNLIMTDYEVPTNIFNVRTDLIFTGIEYLLLILTIIRATTLITIDALKRALTILFAITSTFFILFKFIPYVLFPGVDFQDRELKAFQIVSNFSFVPSFIGTLIGTIYVDIVKKKHEETKKKEEERVLRALIYKSALARSPK